jgi:hypothetical protein
MSNAFDPDNLFDKAKVYVQRALNEDREKSMFPLWLSLSLELLARSALARISPTLLAEVPGNDGTHLLYALGHTTTQSPRSVPISTVFERLTKVDIGFTEEAKNAATSIINQRNAELHSAQIGFEEYPVSLWLGDFYRIADTLSKSQGRTLSDYLGDEEADAATRMITEKNASLKKDVFKRIDSHRQVIQAATQEDLDQKITQSTIRRRAERRPYKSIKCPACHNASQIFGDFISISPPRLVDDEIVVERRFLPTMFTCYVCGLVINGFSEIDAISLSGQFTVIECLDPVEYHNIEVAEYIDVNELVEQRLRDAYHEGSYRDE